MWRSSSSNHSHRSDDNDSGIIENSASVSNSNNVDNDEILSRKRGCNWSSCCTVFFRLLQLGNTIVIGLLIVLVLAEYKRIEELEQQIPSIEKEINGLENEVQTKQQTQITQLENDVQEEHNLTFLTLAGIFTLLTCLITMFHMSTHLQKMNQPIIQRKIISILWMSPIYGVTSFLSLIFPPMDGYLAIIKDFYEAYCIYTFLAFLIAVLGKGSREKASEVLARHADHMEEPTRCLRKWYDPPPDTSPVAKASAVIMECQIKTMQFVFIRPLTTVLFVLHKSLQNSKADEGDNSDVASAATSLETMVPTSYPTMVSTDESSNTIGQAGNNNGTRWLQSNETTFFGGSGTALQEANNETSWLDTFEPTAAPTIEDFLGTFDPSSEDEFATSSPFSSNDTDIIQPQNNNGDFTEATKAYFQSFGFFLAMIVNISVFFAFAGLLKFYHAAQEDLKWCKPFPKFLTIKGVVFMTFWQGLMIQIIVNLTNEDDDASEQARRYQNILICMEMLVFSLTHWCVFPAEEWEKDYKPPEKAHKPGIGIQDFVSDVGYIVKSGRQNSRHKRHSRRRKFGGKYHKPPLDSLSMMTEEQIPSEAAAATTTSTSNGTSLSSMVIGEHLPTTAAAASTRRTNGSSRQRSFSDVPPARQRSFSDGEIGLEDDDDDDSSDDLSLI